MSIRVTGLNEVLHRLKSNKASKHSQTLIERYALKTIEEEWDKIGVEVDVQLIKHGKGFEIIVSGEQVLFFEFGAGIRYAGQSHPKAGYLGLGPGTYPGKGHWNNPRGWWYTASNPSDPNIRKYTSGGGGSAHTYGNPAYAPTYLAGKKIEAYLKRRKML